MKQTEWYQNEGFLFKKWGFAQGVIQARGLSSTSRGLLAELNCCYVLVSQRKHTAWFLDFLWTWRMSPRFQAHKCTPSAGLLNLCLQVWVIRKWGLSSCFQAFVITQKYSCTLFYTLETAEGFEVPRVSFCRRREKVVSFRAKSESAGPGITNSLTHWYCKWRARCSKHPGMHKMVLSSWLNRVSSS